MRSLLFTPINPCDKFRFISVLHDRKSRSVFVENVQNIPIIRKAV